MTRRRSSSTCKHRPTDRLTSQPTNQSRAIIKRTKWRDREKEMRLVRTQNEYGIYLVIQRVNRNEQPLERVKQAENIIWLITFYRGDFLFAFAHVLMHAKNEPYRKMDERKKRNKDRNNCRVICCCANAAHHLWVIVRRASIVGSHNFSVNAIK